MQFALLLLRTCANTRSFKSYALCSALTIELVYMHVVLPIEALRRDMCSACPRQHRFETKSVELVSDVDLSPP